MGEEAHVRCVGIVEVLRDCERFLVEERGVAPATGKEYCRKAAVCEAVGGAEGLSRLAAADVAGYVVDYAVGHCWESCRTMLRAVRAFLRYGHVAGLCADSADAVPSVARRRDTAPRRGVSVEWVETFAPPGAAEGVVCARCRAGTTSGPTRPIGATSGRESRLGNKSRRCVGLVRPVTVV